MSVIMFMSFNPPYDTWQEILMF